MKYLKLTILFILILSTKANAQKIDSTFFYECRQLQKKGMLEEARNCYLQHDTSSNSIYKAATISKQLEDWKTFKKLSEKLCSKKYASPTSYKLCADLYANDSTRYISIINKGLKRFKKDQTLLIQRVNYFLKNKDFTSAINTIDKLLQLKEEDITSLLFAKGVAYEALNDTANALIYYEEAINSDPNYFNAYYNIATIHYNRAVAYYNQINSDIDHNKYVQLQSEAQNELAKAIPFLTKAASISPTNLLVLKPLKIIYYKLERFDEYNAIQKQIDQLKQ